VSIDTKIKIESNTIQKYQGNVITLEEARRELGFSNEVSEEDMYAFTITQKGKLDLVDAQANAAIKTAKATAALNVQQTQSSSNDDGLDNEIITVNLTKLSLEIEQIFFYFICCWSCVHPINRI